MNQETYSKLLLTVSVLFITIFIHAVACFSQEEDLAKIAVESETADEVLMVNGTGGNDDQQKEKLTMFQLLKKGGVVGYLIIFLSFIALSLVIDYALTIKKSKLAPIDDITALEKLIKDHDFKGLSHYSRAEASFLSQVTAAGLNDINLGYQSMVKAMEDVSEALNARLARKIEHLNVIGNISPMLGLLGTVMGMLRCFNEISHVTGAIEPKLLAGGIFEALITTCLGLIVAIPSLYFYAFFRNRVDEYTGEASLAAEKLLSPFKPGSQGK